MEGKINIYDSVFNQIGETGLIIQAKALEFLKGRKSTEDELDRLINMITTSETSPLNENKKLLIQSVLYYFIAEYDRNKAFNQNKLENLQNSGKSMRSGLSIDQLHLIFNVIEFEDKFKTLNPEKLKMLENQLLIYEKAEKSFIDYILYKYYSAVLKYLLRDFNFAKMNVLDITADISDVNAEDRDYFLDYIDLKNSTLSIRILEQEKDFKEELSYLECLFETYRTKQKEELIVKLGFKMCDILYMDYEFDKMYTLLIQLFKILKKNVIIGEIKFENFLEISLNIISRIIYCTIMIGKQDEISRFIKKLEKIITVLKEKEKELNLNNKQTVLDNYTKFSFYLSIFKQIYRYGTMDKTELNSSLNEFKKKFHSIKDEEIINIYAMNSSDTLANKFHEKLNSNLNTIQTSKFTQINHITLFFSIYNQISILTKNVTSDTNIKKQLEYISNIKALAKSLIIYINKYLELNYINVLMFAYFKEALIKIYMSYIYTFYFSKDYEGGLSIIQEFEGLKNKLDLCSGGLIKHYSGILKLKGDILFKKNDYIHACNVYSKVLQIYDDVNNHSHTRALVLFNLGSSYLFAKEYNISKDNLTQSLNKYELLNKIYPAQFNEKISQIGNMINQLNSSIFS